MLTPQDIAEKPLSKVRFGGYDMGEVDDFLEEVTEDYSALYKENAILKGKLKVLVEKVEEYRTTEDSMRMALLTAQKVSENIKIDADKQREAVLRDAKEEIKAKLAETAKRVADEEHRLSVAAKETSKFIELSQAVMARHSEFLAKLEAATRVLHETKSETGELSSVAAPAQAPVVQTDDKHVVDVAAQIDSAVQRLTKSDPVAPAPIAAPVAPPPITQGNVPAPSAQQSPPPYDVSTAPTTTFTRLEELDETSPRPKFDFDDLRFGENF